MLRGLRADLRFARGSMREQPGLTLLSVLALASGIGASTAIFSIVHTTLLRPLPFRDASRLVQIETVRAGEKGRISMQEIEDLETGTELFENIAAYVPGMRYAMSGSGDPEEPAAVLATHDLLEVLGVPLLRGTGWPPIYDRERHFGILVSHRLWQRRFGGDEGIIGETVTLDAAPFYRVFGVVPPGHDFPTDTDLYRSIFIRDWFPRLHDRSARNVMAIGRLREGVERAEAEIVLKSFATRLARRFPDTNRNVGLSVMPLRESLVGGVRPWVLLLLAAVALVLLIVSVNVANLLLSRSLTRERELAVRSALGAGRSTIVRHLTVEATLFALAGGALGVLLAWLWLPALTAVVRLDLPSWMEVRIDFPVLGFALLLSLVVGVGVGLVPGFRASSRRTMEPLRESGHSSRSGHRFRAALVVAEVALSLVLLAGAGLMMRTFVALFTAELGFEPRGVLSFRVKLPYYSYDDDEKLVRFLDGAIRELRALPGVKRVATNSNLPLTPLQLGGRHPFVAEGQSSHELEANPYANFQTVSTAYFETLQIRLLRGRSFSSRDRADTLPVAIVSRRLAERVWPGEDAIGRRLRSAQPDAEWSTVIGVVENVRHRSISSPPGFDVYQPNLQAPPDTFHVLLSTEIEPMSLVDDVRRAIWRIDADQPIFPFRPLSAIVLDSIWQQRVATLLLGLFAIVALLLAATGIYGVMSVLVSTRRQEIGIRMALGARRKEVMRGVLAEALTLSLVGVALGLGGAWWATRLMESLLYGIGPRDAWTLFSVAGLLVLVALAAAAVPASRAATIDPAVTLRAR